MLETGLLAVGVGDRSFVVIDRAGVVHMVVPGYLEGNRISQAMHG